MESNQNNKKTLTLEWLTKEREGQIRAYLVLADTWTIVYKKWRRVLSMKLV